MTKALHYLIFNQLEHLNEPKIRIAETRYKDKKLNNFENVSNGKVGHLQTRAYNIEDHWKTTKDH